MDPQKKSDLMQFTTAVKAVIYDAGRMKEMLPLLDTRGGAIKAVQVVISVVEQKKPIPPGVAPLLAVNTYMLLVDMAREITGQEPDPAIVKGVTDELLATMQQSHGKPPAQPAQPQPPQGILQKAMA